MNPITLNLATEIAPNVASRDAVATLRERIGKLPENPIHLDMANVEFLSRSAAHELLQVKEYFAAQTPKKTLDFTNLNDAVSSMLRIVASNRAVPKAKEEAKPIETVSIEELEHSSPLNFLKRLFAQ